MPAARVARGEAEIAASGPELLTVPGVVVIAPLPGELDGQFVFAAALVSGTGRADAGRKLIAFLVTPRAREVIQRQGMPAGGLVR